MTNATTKSAENPINPFCVVRFPCNEQKTACLSVSQCAVRDEPNTTAILDGMENVIERIPLCTVPASPRDADWNSRLAEELAALIKFVSACKSSGFDWIRLHPVPGSHGTSWSGEVRTASRAQPEALLLTLKRTCSATGSIQKSKLHTLSLCDSTSHPVYGCIKFKGILMRRCVSLPSPHIVPINAPRNRVT